MIYRGPYLYGMRTALIHLYIVGVGWYWVYLFTIQIQQVVTLSKLECSKQAFSL